MDRYNEHVRSVTVGIADCVNGSEKLKDESDNFIRRANERYTRETEEKMIKFTSNFVNELTYLTKRHEDQILFKIGYYGKMPIDERDPKSVAKFNIDKNQLFEALLKDIRPKSA